MGRVACPSTEELFLFRPAPTLELVLSFQRVPSRFERF